MIAPTEIRPLLQSKILEVDWADGQRSSYSFESLRVNCPCASCKGHSPAEAKVIVGKENIGVLDVQPVGNYAIKLFFDDGHNTGIYSWDWLRKHAG